MGNGITTGRSYDPVTGRLTGLAATGGSTVQQQGYAYDALGNLFTRTDTAQGYTETFGYDALNRLTSVTGPAPKTYGYDGIGNLTTKSGVGTYSYPASGATSVRPHAVTSIAGSLNGVTNPSFGYDANGNLLTGGGRSFTYTSFNLPASVTQGGVTMSFAYDTRHARFKETGPAGTLHQVHFAGGAAPFYEKLTRPDGVIEDRHYISGGAGLAAVYTQRSNGVNDTRYLSADHLGSVAVITNETGGVVERLSFDAFGKRRNANGQDATGITSALMRGYTGHEQLDPVGLIHMNGRVYDPGLGRFTSADPFVTRPANGQSFNRYSYVVNNPLKFVDPSGFEMEFGPWLINPRNGDVQRGGYDPDSGTIELQVCTFCSSGSSASAPTLSNYQQGGISGVSNGTSFASPNASSTASATQSTTTTSNSSSTTYSTTVTFTNTSGPTCPPGSCGVVSSGGSGAGAPPPGGSGAGPIAPGVSGLAASSAFRGFFSQAAPARVAVAFNECESLGCAGAGKPWNGFGPPPVIANAQRNLGIQVGRFFDRLIDDVGYLLKSDSVVLGRNLTHAGYERTDNQHAHHIVGSGAEMAEPARQVLANVGMDINSAFNGVFLDASYHSSLHTNLYYQNVNLMLSGATSYADVAARLTVIRGMLDTQTFPH